MAKIVKKPQAVADLESALVRAVRSRGAVSRFDLARELKLVASTAGIYVDRLVESGYLVESTKAARGVGRPPVLLELNPRRGRFIGVDFDARQIMTVSVDFAQRPLTRRRRTLPPCATAGRVLGVIEKSIREAIGSRTDDVLGIGLGVPGPIDAEHGTSLAYKFIADWRDVPIVSRMAASFASPVFVENNLRSMALGELWCGRGRGLTDLVCLGVRSGIGSGVIVGGKLLRGSNNLAGEIGRWTCPEALMAADSAPSAREQSPRTIEDAASVTAIEAQAAERLAQGQKSLLGRLGDKPSVADVLKAAMQDDALANMLVEQAARVHGWVVHQLAALLDPQRIVVAGPLAESDAYLHRVREAAAHWSGPHITSRVVRSTLGEFAGALGAAALAFHHWQPRR